ncbi:MAG TPA: hypothetical protein VF476_15005 [Chitinophagaceae bacterium]
MKKLLAFIFLINRKGFDWRNSQKAIAAIIVERPVHFHLLIKNYTIYW